MTEFSEAQTRGGEAPLAGLLAYAEREAARRARGTHPGMLRLQDDELAALLDLLRREVGPGMARDREGAHVDRTLTR